MDYYRRYVGDYLADTQGLSLAEDGAYGRLLDYYYAKEAAIPQDKVFEVARATKASDRAAVRSVLEQHFVLEDDGRYHNPRADKELGIAVPKINKLREVARENGKKGGRPKKETKSGSPEKPDPVSELKPNPVPTEKQPARVNQPPSANHQPPQEPLSDERFPGVGDSPAPARTAGVTQTQVNPDATARILAECTRAKLEEPTEANSIIARWIRSGATPVQVAHALTDARKSMPEPKTLKAGYVDTILTGIMQAEATARRQAEAKVAASTKLREDQRDRAKEAVPPPQELIAKFAKKHAA